MAIRSKTSNIVTEWELDASGHIRTIEKVEDRYGQFEKKSQSIGKATSALGGIFDVSVGNIAAKAAMKLAGALVDVAKEAGRFSRVSNAFRGDIEKLRNATQGLVSDLDLMASANQMSALGVKLNSDEQASLLRNLGKMSAAMGTDLKYSLDSATTALARQSKLMADNVGVVMNTQSAYEKMALTLGKNVDKLTDLEKGQAFQRDFLNQLEEKASQLPERISTIGDAFTKMWIATKNWVVNIVSSINTGLVPALEKVGRIVSGNAMRATSYDPRAAAEELKGTRVQGPSRSLQEVEGMFVRDELSSFTNPMFSETANLESARIQRAAQENAAMEKARQARMRQLRFEIAGARQAREFEGQAQGYADILKAVEAYKKLDAITEKFAETKASVEVSALDRARAAWGAASIDTDLAIQRSNEFIAEAERFNAPIEKMKVSLQSLATDGFLNLASGIWAAADAAIQGSTSFGAAMADMTKAILLNLAQQATVMALMETGKGIAAWWNGYAASRHFTAAAVFGTVAAIAGGTGLAISAGQASAQGSRSAARDKEEARVMSGRGNTPSIGRSVSKSEAPPIYVNVYIGDKSNPSAILIGQKQVEAIVRQVAA